MSDLCLIEEVVNRKKSLVDAAVANSPNIRMSYREQWLLSVSINDDPIVRALTNLMIAKRQFETSPTLAIEDSQK